VDKWLTKETRMSMEASLLTTIPGVGKFTAMLLLAEIGDIRYFRSPKNLTGYAGLAPRIRQSGQHTWLGPLRADCNKYIRWACCEAETKAVRVVPAWKRPYDNICAQDASKKPVARAAVARKIIRAAWRVLTTGEPFDHLAAGKEIPRTARPR
jgi:transposase